jgi:predicted transcriptional regulator
VPTPIERTPASRKLAELLRQHPELKQGIVAASVGCSQPSVSQYASGIKRPESHIVRLRFERVFGIPVIDWLTKKERDALDALAPLAA